MVLTLCCDGAWFFLYYYCSIILFHLIVASGMANLFFICVFHSGVS